MNSRNRKRVLSGLPPKRTRNTSNKQPFETKTPLPPVEELKPSQNDWYVVVIGKHVETNNLKLNKNNDCFIEPSIVSTPANPYYVEHIKICASLNREELFELGRRAPYFRFVSYPIDFSPIWENNVPQENRNSIE